MKTKTLTILASVVLAILAAVAYPLVSITMRTRAAYRFACDIVPQKTDLPSIERRFRKPPKETYDDVAQAPDWIQDLLSKADLPEKRCSVYYFVYEGIPSFLFLLVCEGASDIPFASIVWEGENVRVIKN